MIRVWLLGALRRRPARLVGTAVGIAIAVALLASLGSFLAHAKATMTARAVRGVTVDWQVQVQTPADAGRVLSDVRAMPEVRTVSTVDFGATPGLSATTGGSTQTTGAGVVLGLPADYRTTFPGELRTLIGADSGVLLAQQTAANLHAAPGDTVQIARTGASAVRVKVAGIVDLPQADSLFQRVGAPVGSQPSAPPDNVVLLPNSLWQQGFAGGARQIHVGLDHRLPSDPASAYTRVVAAAHNLEARASGAAQVGNNLAAALDAARQDAAYAQVLFVFLGLPGALLAGLLTATLAASGAARRRAEQALLRARGATAAQLVRLAAVEATLTGVLGAALGLGAAAIVGQLSFGSAAFGTSASSAAVWSGASAVVGLLIAAAAVLMPARRALRRETVAAGRATLGTLPYPAWARYGLDAAALIGADLVFTSTSHNGYQLVLAPEGVPTISVSYWAFAGPALLWLGGGLLAWRLADGVLGRGRPVVARALRPLARRLSGVVAGGMSRQRRPLVRATVLLALAVCFAVSTATFNATYRHQAEADAQLTNGADVTVTEAPGGQVGPDAARTLSTVAGVRAVEPIQHRFAYVGTDLQDLYGVRPETIRHVTALQDAYFRGGSAAALMGQLNAHPDSILVSAETVKDFQLHPGDTLNLRLVDNRTHHQRAVPFHYVGIVAEFPTAPKDSFFVANADYIARMSGSSAVGAFLVDTGGRHTGGVAQRIQSLLGPSAQVTDIGTVRHSVGSSLTSVDLAGLTRVELGFALVLAATAGGLVFALGLAERRRSFAILAALGARRRHLRGLIASETLVLAVCGLLAGAALGWALSGMLVKVLTGVFDPPPSTIAVPWTYLVSVVIIAVGALTAVTALTVRTVARPAPSILREL
ncbi:MAG TPA: ABC transporter permease [Jatrophihabitantaceae bacterium]